MTEKSPEQIKNEEAQAELKKRIEGFNAKLIPLLGEFKLGLGAEPVIIDGAVRARPILFDDSKSEVKPKEAATEAPKSDLASE